MGKVWSETALPQLCQPHLTWWTRHTGSTSLPPWPPPAMTYHNCMCPQGVALSHPAATLLQEYTTHGCPINTGPSWSHNQLNSTIAYGPHESALTADAIDQLSTEVHEKLSLTQVTLVPWAASKHDPPTHLKISPIAMVPHKSQKFWVVLDLSFSCHGNGGCLVLSVNSTTIKTAPLGSIDQLGHYLQKVIQAFAMALHDDPIFMAKWDIKDFCRLNCAPGHECTSLYVLPS